MASPIIRARMEAIIAACDAVLSVIVDKTRIEQVAKLRADALERLEGDG